MTARDKTLDLEGKEHLEWHGCDLPVVQVSGKLFGSLVKSFQAF